MKVHKNKTFFVALIMQFATYIYINSFDIVDRSCVDLSSFSLDIGSTVLGDCQLLAHATIRQNSCSDDHIGKKQTVTKRC